jgi:hypothetical protein
MLSTFDLAYGRETVPFTFAAPPEVLRVSDPAPAVDTAVFRQRVRAFLDAAGLDLRRPAVVVADKTRLCGYPTYLPVLLAELLGKGAPEDGLTIYIAYGTHGRQSEIECRSVYGEVYERFHWVHHACKDRSLFVQLGQTRRGTPVRLRADMLHATCLITFGAISHHYFAGFGGGRKLIFPGLGEREAIYANHGLFLDHGRRALSAGCRPGQITGNPLAVDLAEVARFKPADLAVHAILDSHGRVCDLSVGRLIVLARCPDGIGSGTFLPWFGLGGFQPAFERLAQGYVGNGGTALAMMEKTRRIRIALVTDMNESEVLAMGCEKITMDQARQAAVAGRWAVIPNAGLLVRRQGDE